jgi:multiple sugar transport system permease protein
MLPDGVLLILFAVYPTLQLIRMAFSIVRFERGQFIWSYAGPANFVRLPTDPIVWESVSKSVIFIATTVPLTLLLGTALALLVDRSVLFVGVARNVLLWPALVAPVVVSVIWLLVLSPNIGVLDKLLATLGWPEQGWLGDPAGAMFSVILVDVWHWTSIVFLLVYTALKGIPADLLEAGRLDGASESQALRYIVLPLLGPALATAALIRLVMGVKVFDEMYLLTQGGPGTATTLVSLYVRDVFFDRLDLGYGAAFSLAIVVATAAVAFAAFATIRHVSRPVQV